ncbi:MBL fold metallo-hydrolase [Luteolibacter pohnpeiensis]|uniref:MBL fold metallo-hydrolase n=1 Tax=Luteolibacter pohnpeiensis TaxID=454153 RepID=A0A934S7M4_9BACT|nr:MBL fold metallo-hydrolase [Luteolibacter pohnpeiensis]MBK1882795.1 MBL fold metallo-hydrolase [Luteolibacter pohnpeiensis]
MIFKSLCRHAGIGANSYLIETSAARVVLDAGMHPKHEGNEAVPHFEFLEPGSVDSIVISHSHLDHVGTLPVFLESQPQAKVFLSPETAELSSALLHNSVNVMQSKRIELGIAEYPLFDHKELDQITETYELRGIERPFELDQYGTLKATFHDAGHILGSVGMTIKGDGKTIFYTGDVNFEDATVQKGALFPEEPVDALIVETTRGDHARRPDYARSDEEDALAAAIQGVLERRGSVLIPVFAMGKTQEVLGMLQRFKKEGLIPKTTPVYIGGLSTKMTLVYDRHSKTSRRKMQGFRFMKDMEIEAGKRKRTGPIPFLPGCIYALSSGMMTEKTVSNNFARMGVLENKKHGLFFVGYADPESPGGRIRAAQPGDEILLDPAYPKVKLNCEVKTFDFSGHSTREAIADYIVKVRPKKAFLVHGDEPAIEWFRQEIAARLPDTEIIVPQPGEPYEI